MLQGRFLKNIKKNIIFSMVQIIYKRQNYHLALKVYSTKFLYQKKNWTVYFCSLLPKEQKYTVQFFSDIKILCYKLLKLKQIQNFGLKIFHKKQMIVDNYLGPCNNETMHQ